MPPSEVHCPVNENLPSLSDLYIEDCPMLQSLPDDGLPSSLKHLQIQTCPLLTERCQKEGGGGPDWPKIEEIPDLEIDYSHIVVPSTSPENPPVWLVSSIFYAVEV
ncbi:hypothetical protein SLA2020_431190 [Shorea laevis]